MVWAAHLLIMGAVFRPLNGRVGVETQTSIHESACKRIYCPQVVRMYPIS